MGYIEIYILFFHLFLKKGLTNPKKIAAKPLNYNYFKEVSPMNFAFTVKSKLQMEILKLEQHLPFFVKNPGHDFIRNRKLSFQKNYTVPAGNGRQK